MLLKELLEVNKDGLDFELYHNEYEVDVASICELSMDTFTKEGFEKWHAVLNAEIDKAYTSHGRLYVIVKGVSYRTVEKFTYALAGYVSVSDYDKWFK